MTAASPPPIARRRRQRDAERTRAAIVQAAREVFLRGDYHQASLSDIAHRAGVAQSLIHHHFGSKKGLYVAAVHAFLAELDEDLKGIIQPVVDTTGKNAPEEAAAFISAALTAYFRFLSANEQCVRFYRILDLSMHNDPDLVAGLDELDDQGREMSTLHLMRAAHDRLTLMKERGQLREGVEPLPLLSAMLCTVEHWFTSSRRLNHRLSQAVGRGGAGCQGGIAPEEYLRTVVEVFLRGALAEPGR
ncbi:transcriptional regulator, TetR family [Humidesulfovibrio mexicanus]|uniref:Transcriptional regulator, TetR family n=1 Tax=Humidesulfovibrio mexicanus TaxID=147047 RepID=A0A239BEB9_9BACT|nr:TetR/AcrR family transcriptional regulator [Humidesulfovibrio mexicanus]SNS06377.1 transcriptional regulator, TetR family [Humidesulfovibrio mexicanus]